MTRLSVGDVAPEFALPDHEGNPVKLSEMLGSHKVLMVFNLGFV